MIITTCKEFIVNNVSMQKKRKLIGHMILYPIRHKLPNMPATLRYALVRKRIKIVEYRREEGEKKARRMALGAKIGGRSMPNRALYHAIINRFFPFKHSLAIIQKPPTSKGRWKDICFLPKPFLPTKDLTFPFVA